MCSMKGKINEKRRKIKWKIKEEHIKKLIFLIRRKKEKKKGELFKN